MPDDAPGGETTPVRPGEKVVLSKTYGDFKPFEDNPDEWEVWCERLELYFCANDVPMQKRVPLLLTLLSNATYSLLRDLCTPEKPAAKDFNTLTTKLSSLHAKSRFWYFMNKTHNVKLKKSAGEILSLNKIYEEKPLVVKNYGIFLKYNSRTGTHNLYKEFRDTTRVGAINQLYQDMASRHRARAPSVQVMEIKTVKAKDTVRPGIKQFHDSKIKFPLPHRRLRVAFKGRRSRFLAHRPTTHFR